MDKFDEIIRAIAKQEMPENQHHLIEAYQNSIYFWANQNLSLARRWIIDTDIMLEKPLEKISVQDFFIKLNGIVDELYEHYRKKIIFLTDIFSINNTDSLTTTIQNNINNHQMKVYLMSSVQVFSDLGTLRSLFTEFELRQIKYFRHEYCHPILTKLSMKINKKDKIYTGHELDQLMQKIATTDKLEAMELFHKKIMNHRSTIKRLDNTLKSMKLI